MGETAGIALLLLRGPVAATLHFASQLGGANDYENLSAIVGTNFLVQGRSFIETVSAARFDVALGLLLALLFAFLHNVPVVHSGYRNLHRLRGN